MATTTITRPKKATGVQYSRTRSITWLGGNQGSIDCYVSGRAGRIGEPLTVVGLPNRNRSRAATEYGIRSAINAGGFNVPRQILIDVFAKDRIKGMTGPLDLAMVTMALSASKQIEPVDWPTLIVGYVNGDGEFISCGEELAQCVYDRIRQLSGYQLICPKALLEEMPINGAFEYAPIGLEHIGDLRTHPVFNEPLG
ncbi:MAG: hypothetical protein J0H98_07170 [Solirubrobacterales bacterium]|nr:hypothetical protein [Solirubrobacterales bacterium]